MKTRKILLWALALMLIIFSIKSPMGLVFPMWILAFLYKEKMRGIVARFPRSIAFVVLGLFFGLLTESFAILDNINKSPTERILLSPDPFHDLFLAFFYYLFFSVTWYLLLRKIRFSKKAVFMVSGIFGILSEQGGAIAHGIIANPPSGSLLAFLVMSVYGIFPLCAYMITKERFIGGKRPHIKEYAIAGIAFFFFWAIYGNFIHKVLLSFLVS